MQQPRESFATTHWSRVMAAQDGASPEAREALAQLCATYWYPLYAYVRRRGHGADAAHDLTQAFFTRVIEKGSLRAADQARGRFRSFLLTSLQHFLCNEHDRSRAAKRGGGRAIRSLDPRDAEDRYRQEPGHDLTPERLFERRWALTLLDQVLDRLQHEWDAEGKGTLFQSLKPTLTGNNAEESYRHIAQIHGLSEGAIKVTVHRLRRRYRVLLREEIGRTLDDAAAIDEEIRNLFAVLGS
jgi:RNA polymerase sigma-70 factor (ECF subfamily)